VSRHTRLRERHSYQCILLVRTPRAASSYFKPCHRAASIWRSLGRRDLHRVAKILDLSGGLPKRYVLGRHLAGPSLAAKAHRLNRTGADQTLRRLRDHRFSGLGLGSQVAQRLFVVISFECCHSALARPPVSQRSTQIFCALVIVRVLDPPCFAHRVEAHTRSRSNRSRRGIRVSPRRYITPMEIKRLRVRWL